MLAIPLMDEDAAAKLAQAEGIVCHLTSLVLVDEAGERQAGLPAPRKIALSPPRTDLMAQAPARMLYCLADMDDSRSRAGHVSYCLSRPAEIETRRRTLRGAHLPPRRKARRGHRTQAWYRRRAGPTSVCAIWPGVSIGTPIRRRCVTATLRAAARCHRRHRVCGAAARDRRLCARVGIAPVVAVIGLLAKSARGSSRSAGRLARAILKKASDSDLAAAMSRVGL